MKTNVNILITAFLILCISCIGAGCLDEEEAPAYVSDGPVGVSYTYSDKYPLAFHNAFYQQEAPDVIFELENRVNESVKLRITAEYTNYSSTSVITETLAPEETAEVPVTILLDADRISGIKTTTMLNLHVKVEDASGDKQKIYDEQTIPVKVYPMDTFLRCVENSDGETEDLSEYLAVFVTPQSQAVNELIGKAKEYATTEYDADYPEYGLERSLQGYMFEGPEDEYARYTDLQVKAIYNALKYGYGISYVDISHSTGAPDETIQRISTPDESLALSSANCIDGTVLFASALEALSMKPYIVTVPGHAYVAWNVDGSGDELHALETTMIGDAPFEDALQAGTESLKENEDKFADDDPDNEYYLLDVTKARENGIYPME